MQHEVLHARERRTIPMLPETPHDIHLTNLLQPEPKSPRRLHECYTVTVRGSRRSLHEGVVTVLLSAGSRRSTTGAARAVRYARRFRLRRRFASAGILAESLDGGLFRRRDPALAASKAAAPVLLARRPGVVGAIVWLCRGVQGCPQGEDRRQVRQGTSRRPLLSRLLRHDQALLEP